MVRLPVRLDFIGGWSDQVEWTETAAVINAAIGWDGVYPLTLDGDRLHSEINGVGTGLGVSSILAAGRFLAANPGGDYVSAGLAWEQAQGTRGGWQDQIGGITPGMKLINRGDDVPKVKPWREPEPSIWPHLVLFDTGTRRLSKGIGEQVRAKLRDRGLRVAIRRNVATAWQLYDHCPAPEEFAGECLAGWRRLVEQVPDIEVPLPVSPLLWGAKLLGAGGGGYGVAFVKDPATVPEVCAWFRSHRMWAVAPELLPGAQFS